MPELLLLLVRRIDEWGGGAASACHAQVRSCCGGSRAATGSSTP